MPTQEIRQQANQRLEELYQRHLSLHEDEVVSYYTPGIGYRKPETLRRVRSVHNAPGNPGSLDIGSNRTGFHRHRIAGRGRDG